MLGIDILVNCNDSAETIVDRAIRNYGFRLCDNDWRRDRIHNLRLDFYTKSISFNTCSSAKYDVHRAPGFNASKDRNFIDHLFEARYHHKLNQRGRGFRSSAELRELEKSRAFRSQHTRGVFDMPAPEIIRWGMDKGACPDRVVKGFWKTEEKFNQMKIVKTKTVEFNGTERDVTIVVRTDGNGRHGVR